ncbi:cytochrome C oxidase subunit IV family protein [Rhizobium sp. KVB221]|uniref:Cytochrome C oxidase subunit IV family protein n=1 Tax=Rhizobium setariae TaxID=2801340 RepID=A0A936YSP9_9HYPH|nr:cytochrome C oxidase subunit IV family protein [Rhizobium setariae]MBL0373564.1 cytochrome C oxidase subunit IV family protein [Rhizobium setariae]
MERRQTWLLGSAIGLTLAACVAALIAAQWKHEAVPVAALAIILVLTVVKSRIVILDFMGLRGLRPGLSTALLVWSAFFAVATVAKAMVQLFAA